MSEWIIQIAGTPEGARLASVLALGAAFLHALFGSLQKGRHDPWISRAAIDLSYGIMALPIALFVVPWPDPGLWPVLFGAMGIHVFYKIAQALTYTRGAYTVVYPVVRGTGPLFAVIAAGVVFGEHFNAVQWLGVGLLVGGIFGLADYNRSRLVLGRETLGPALAWAVVTGGFVALYTTYDAWGIRLAANPFTFLAWFFVLDSFFMPIWNLRRLIALTAPEVPALAMRGIFGALVAFASFGAIMLATRIDDVGRAAVLRETSTVFAALVGWLVLGEKVGVARAILMAVIASGALVVEFAS